jgi:hypothetical protein
MLGGKNANEEVSKHREYEQRLAQTQIMGRSMCGGDDRPSRRTFGGVQPIRVQFSLPVFRCRRWQANTLESPSFFFFFHFLHSELRHG